VWMVTLAGIEITTMVDGRTVFGPTVMTWIEVGILIEVALDGNEITSVAGVTDDGMLTMVTLAGIEITTIDDGRTVFGPTVTTEIDGGI